MKEFDEYLRAKEPDMRERAYAWKTAIGLQKVDGLTPSAYLIRIARRNIEGEITLAESRKLVEGYYKARPVKSEEPDRVKEADLVSQHIAEILAEPTFSLTPASFAAIHRKLFRGVFTHAGKIRDYNITKSEWVLDKDTVRYESADVIAATLEYEFERERRFDYKGLNPQETVAHIVRFVSDVWQVHAFGEGNTRTTSIFTIKYLRHLGYDVTNDVFAENAWYFRNALVRANYTNLPRGIHPTTVYLERFFSNLLLGGRYELKSRFLHISDPVPPSELVPSRREQVGEQVKSDAIEKIKARPSKFVVRLLSKMKGEMTVLQMMAAVKLGGRRNFLERYLSPAVDAGFVEMTQPDSPRSPTQRYRLTEKGAEALERGGKSEERGGESEERGGKSEEGRARSEEVREKRKQIAESRRRGDLFSLTLPALPSSLLAQTSPLSPPRFILLAPRFHAPRSTGLHEPRGECDRGMAGQTHGDARDAGARRGHRPRPTGNRW